MKLRFFVSIVLLLVLSTVVGAQDNVTYEPYTSADGRISFDAPAGWLIAPFGPAFNVTTQGYVEAIDTIQPGQQQIDILTLNAEDLAGAGVTSDLPPVDFVNAVFATLDDGSPITIEGTRTMTLDSGAEVGVIDISYGAAKIFVTAYPQDDVIIFVSSVAHESEFAAFEPVALHLINSIQLGETAAEASPMPEYPIVPIIATDDGIQLPPVPEGGVPEGIFQFQMTNNRTEGEFSGVIARINDDVTMEQFMEAASAEDPMAAVAMVTLNGGSPLQPGESTSYILHLVPGNHIILNFAGDGPPTDAATFTVVEGDIMDVAEPIADVHLAMVDFAFGVPGFMPAGEQLWHLENVGDQWHETVIIPLPEGIESVSDVLEVMASGNEPDIQPAFFWAPMSPGAEAWVTVDLAPGNYVILCFLPDLNGDFSPHMNHGMIQVFTVQ
jgi:hypothetical protein